MSDPYTVLGVPQHADYDTMKKAHHGLCMEFYTNTRNPDLCAAAHEKFKRVQDAWKILSNDSTRAELDRRIRRAENMESDPKASDVRPALQNGPAYNTRSASNATSSYNAGPASHPSADQGGAPETWETAKKVYDKARSKLSIGVERLKEANDLVPTDHPGHPDIHSVKPTADRAKEISEAYHKASKLSTEACIEFRLAKSGFEEALKLSEDAKEAMLSVPILATQLGEYKEMIIALNNHHTEAKNYVETSNNESRKFHFFAMAWFTEAHILEKGDQEGSRGLDPVFDVFRLG
ncbi:uncharacterized protein BDZ99DRAFT_478836 [Mytilinidion resinicola]|uniref:J domain-containing protein n=1 Tax=Mytilinidion resinicola TaxID=574789 RepID=A0A6A6YET9_9PEZI|nr:uncharacterized protein BDZ99DRAFT_478836 [Mytilinidion resinicola]KAF2807346.1 hypothetical protein BDZ99DRAFT_478836 [Mytilinidion resinicola]